MNQTQITQDAFMVMERLAALCATPGINEDTQKSANGYIQTLLDSVVKDAISKLAAKNVGLVIN